MVRVPGSGGVLKDRGGVAWRKRPSAGSSVFTAEHSPKREVHRWPCPKAPCPFPWTRFVPVTASIWSGASDWVALQDLIVLEVTERMGTAPRLMTQTAGTGRAEGERVRTTIPDPIWSRRQQGIDDVTGLVHHNDAGSSHTALNRWTHGPE